MKTFKGIYPALITPFDEVGKIDIKGLEMVIERNIEKGVSGFYIGGSTGESYLLSPTERKQVVAIVTDIVKERVDVIANIGIFATEHGIELARHAQAHGISAISSVPPFYFSFGMQEYIQYYNDLADSVDIPTIIYNIPAMSGVKFSTNDINRLFANEKIVGMKHTSYDLFQMQRVIEMHPEKTVFIGHDELFLPAYAVGATAAIGSTFNFMAEKFIKITELFEKADKEAALKVQGQVNEVIEVLGRIGVFKGIKAALRMQGINCGVCRKPFLSLSNEEISQLEKVLEKNGCLI
ncbi:MAG: N-acetylneuraminate lyase [Suipraeoptans sp.]